MRYVPQCSLQIALFTTARTWKQPKCPSLDEWMKKMWYIYTMEYYLAIKRNEIELFVVRWMELESVIQSEVSQKGNSFLGRGLTVSDFLEFTDSTSQEGYGVP